MPPTTDRRGIITCRAGMPQPSGWGKILVMPDEPADRQSTSRLAEVRLGRIQKLLRLRELGIDPYPASFEGRVPIDEARARGEGAEGRVAGRLLLPPRPGGPVQLQFRRDVLGAETYELLKLLDLGDFIGAQGPLFTTSTGELTVAVQQLTVLSKSLRPLPEKWHGLTDPRALLCSPPRAAWRGAEACVRVAPPGGGGGPGPRRGGGGRESA